MKQSRACCDIESVIRFVCSPVGGQGRMMICIAGWTSTVALMLWRLIVVHPRHPIDRWIVVPRLPNKCAARR
jgi:hypothetical protein